MPANFAANAIHVGALRKSLTTKDSFHRYKVKGCQLTPSAGATAERFEQNTFPDARLSDQNEVAFAADEIAGGQFLDLRSLYGAFEVPVEVLQETDLAVYWFSLNWKDVIP